MSNVAVIDHQVTREDAVLAVISRAATDPNVDIDKMERLLAMQERITAGQSLAAYNSDMAAMQSRMPTISKDAKIIVKGELRSTYASFENIVDTIRPLLEEYGFSVTFKTSFVNGVLHVLGRISHRGGHSEETTIALPFDNTGSKNEVQAIGSSVSYGKRYALCMLLNITTRGEDDDGAAAAPKVDDKDLYAQFRRHMDAVWNNVGSVEAIKEYIAQEDYRAAALCWYELGEEVQRALWVATSKGGVFTTEEREALKSKCVKFAEEVKAELNRSKA